MTRAVRDAQDEIADLFRKSAGAIETSIARLVRWHVSEQLGRGPRLGDREAAFRAVGRTASQAAIVAHLLGARRLLLEADALGRDTPEDLRHAVLFEATPYFPRVPFTEAVDALLLREPRLAPGFQAVQELYRTSVSFALARAADLAIVDRVQEAIATMIAEGSTADNAERIVQRLGGWTRAYAETVYRTNLATSYTAGRFQQAKDPAVAEVIGGFERVALLDSSVRPNHAAGHGLIASTTDPIWHLAAPPSGYNCRCVVRLLTKGMLRRAGALDESTGKVRRILPPRWSEFHPDPGFGARRPDLPVVA